MARITRRDYLKRTALAVAIPFFIRPLSVLAAQPQPTPNKDELAAMEAVARQFMQKFNVPALSVTIARHGAFVTQKAFGFADRDTGEAATIQHLFRIASLSKPVTSVAIFTLIEQQKLKLDDFVFGDGGVLALDFGDNLPARVKKITVHHLLTHTAGGWGKDDNDPMFHNVTLSSRKLIYTTVMTQPLNDEPGTHYAYSNFGYCILGRVIERVSGQSYADFVQQNVLAKCGVTDMRIAGNTLAERAPNEVVYYDSGDDGHYCYTMNMQRMDSPGGWIATPTDLVRFAMHVDGFKTTPNILRAETLKAMTTPTKANPHYACGWAVNEMPNWWHVGSLPGTTTVLVRAASGLCWAAFTNTRAPQMDTAIDEMMWKMVRCVPAWQA